MKQKERSSLKKWVEMLLEQNASNTFKGNYEHERVMLFKYIYVCKCLLHLHTSMQVNMHVKPKDTGNVQSQLQVT